MLRRVLAPVGPLEEEPQSVAELLAVRSEDANPQATSEMYSHIEASELSEVGSRVFNDE